MKGSIYSLMMALIFTVLWGCGEEGVPTSDGQTKQVAADMKNVEERDYATVLIMKKNGEQDSSRTVSTVEDLFDGVEKPYHFTVGIARERRVGEKSMNERVSEWECGDLAELAQVYQEENGKDLSLAHLKVIFLETEEGYREDAYLLKMLEQDVEVAKTVPMLLLEDADDFLEYLEQEEAPVGSYIEDLVRVKNQEGENVNTLADYLRAWREGEAIQPDYLKETKERFRIDSGEQAQKY